MTIKSAFTPRPHRATSKTTMWVNSRNGSSPIIDTIDPFIQASWYPQFPRKRWGLYTPAPRAVSQAVIKVFLS